MNFKSRIEKQDSTLMWYYYILVPNEVAEEFIEGTDRRVICTINSNYSYHCALLFDGFGGYYITVDKKKRDEIGLVRGQELNVELVKDRSEYGMPMSDEFREVMEQVEDARDVFHALTKGKQRTLIYWSDNVKSSDIKIRRALVVMNHVVSREGEIDFKALNEEMKEANKLANRK